LRALEKFRVIPEDRVLDRAIDVEPPVCRRNLRCQAEVERRPVASEMMAGRQALLICSRGLAREEAAFVRPTLLASRQFRAGWRLSFVGHGFAGLPWVACCCALAQVQAVFPNSIGSCRAPPT